MPDASLSPPRRVLYLHGFASSAKSSKAAYFAERLKEHQVALECPDFNEPEFATLTISRMLAQLEDVLDRGAPGPATFIGSSLGGTLAILAAERFAHRV